MNKDQLAIFLVCQLEPNCVTTVCIWPNRFACCFGVLSHVGREGVVLAFGAFASSLDSRFKWWQLRRWWDGQGQTKPVKAEETIQQTIVDTTKKDVVEESPKWSGRGKDPGTFLGFAKTCWVTIRVIPHVRKCSSSRSSSFPLRTMCTRSLVLGVCPDHDRRNRAGERNRRPRGGGGSGGGQGLSRSSFGAGCEKSRTMFFGTEVTLDVQDHVETDDVDQETLYLQHARTTSGKWS